MTADVGGVPDHAALDELAVGWALHALEPEDEALFAVHLPGCRRCAATVAETTEVMGAMARDLPAAEPSEGLRSRLRAAVETAEQRPGPVDPAAPTGNVPGPALDPVPELPPDPEHRPLWRRALPATLVAAAVAAIVGLGLWNVFLATSRERLQETVASQEEVMAAVLDPGQATIASLKDDGRTVATVVARPDEVQVVTSGLSVNQPETTSYVLWGMGEGDPVALGTFDVSRSQMDVRSVGSASTDLDGFPQYGISLEPGQEAPSSPTAVVATGEVTS
jgi:alkylhydroperoxidase family enzyme